MSELSSMEILDQALQAERLGQFDEARALLRSMISSDDGPETLDARLRLGKLLILGGSPKRAEADEVLNVAREQAEKSGAIRLTAIAIHLLALNARQHGFIDEALSILLESPVAKQKGITGIPMGQFFHYRGLIEADRGELNYAERMLFRSHQMYQEVQYEPGMAEVCDSLANLLLKRGKAKSALTFARTSLELKKKLGDRLGEAITWGTIGRGYMLHARYDDAADAFRNDLEIAFELNDARGIGIMLNSLGDVAFLQNNYEGAARCYRENLEAQRGAYSDIYSHLGLARVCIVNGKLEEADECSRQMAELINQGLNSHGLPDALTGLRGAIAWRKGDIAVGERLMIESVEALVKRGQGMETIPLLYELRDLYQSQGDRAKAVDVMARALDLLSECGSERGIEDVEQWLRSVDSPGLTRLALERHFPSWLVEDILGGRMKKPPTRKQEVAVLFSDVRGYTNLTEGLPPEEVVELLNEWFGEATRAIRKYNGTVDKFIGDAVMAVFGVPEPRDDASADAVRAAIEMLEALVAMNLRQKALGGPELRVGVGIDTGVAVVGYIGSHLRRSYTAIGDVVNTASRLESATKNYPGCDILISDRAERGQRLYNVAETAFLGNAALKGKEQKVGLYQVLGLREPKISAHVTL